MRILGRGGTALPGKVAIRICPDLLKHLAGDVICAAITGTNGKTTSSRMLEQFFIDAGYSYFSNKSGSNLMQGITAEFALCATATGKPKRRYAIIECDEAASKKVFEYMDPAVVLVTNVFSDQLDRFGDISVTLENIKTGVKNSPNTKVCLNADDSLISSIADEVANKTIFYGVDPGVLENHADESSGAPPPCCRCGAAYEYDFATYGHLGGFRCPACGHARRIPDVAATGLISKDADTQVIRLQAFGKTVVVTINIPGEYNIYNAVGATAAAIAMGFPIEAVTSALLRFERGFGRMEKLDINGLPVRTILVKNPVGFNQALNYLRGLPGDTLLALCLNDNIADGTDVSWIWDVRFETLLDMGDRLRGILVSGTRSDEMARRLIHAGCPQERMRVFADPGDMLSAALEQGAPVYIMPTYTAMLELRSKIRKAYGLKNFWE